MTTKAFLLCHLLTLPFCASASDNLVKAEAALQAGQYADAQTFFELALKNPTLEARAAVGLIATLTETGGYEKAEEIARKTRKKFASNPDIKASLANILQLTGKYKEARQLYQEIVSRYPSHLPARLALGKLLWNWGEKEAARKTLSFMISHYRSQNDLSAKEVSMVAEACIYLERFRDANRLFNEATQADPGLWQAFVSWGNLMLSKYNIGDARGIFEDALQSNPNSTAANLGLAQTLQFTKLEFVQIEKALAINPDFIEAYNYLAELAIVRGHFEEAQKHLDKALSINPASLPSKTWRAVGLYLNDNLKEFQKEEQQILAINPNHAELYYHLAGQLAKRYLFMESTDFYKKAIALDAEHWPSYAGLGTSLSRLGREDESKEYLEKAFAKDPFNKHVGNLLRLFDDYPKYQTTKTQYLTIRMHKDDAPTLNSYAAALADESFAHLLNLYKIRTDQQVLLEIFPTHDDFAVRCFGLPGAEAFLGICFGNVVAMDSPRARAKGGFVWGETLWHELVHVTHLRLTGNRIPRWFAEGIAVYETSASKPFWGMNLDLPFILAMQNDKLLPLKELDSGFNRNPGQVSISYFQSSLIVEYIIENYGRAKLYEMFPLFRSKLKTPAVIKEVFGRDVDLFDQDFQRYVTKKYRLNEVDFTYEHKSVQADEKAMAANLKKAVEKNPTNPFLNFRYGLYCKKTGEYETAIAYLTKAKTLFPQFVSSGQNPYEILAGIYLEQKQKRKAYMELKQLTELSAKNIETLKKLAALALEVDKPNDAVNALRKALYIDVFDSEIHSKLAKAYLATNQTEKAIFELQTNLQTEPPDLAAAYCDLAGACMQAGQISEAKKNALMALEIAPGYERAQEILLESIERATKNL